MPSMTFRVGPKGQVVIPKAFRDRLGIKPGDKVVFSLADGGVLVEPVRERPSYKGRFSGSRILQSLESEHRTEVARTR
jgi:AbrB family looped-hinge helix DNA binding protein